MQQLRVKSKNVPRNASLVPCSTTLSLNREETLSVVEKSRTCNNLEVNLRQHTGGLKDIVFADGEGQLSPSFQGRRSVFKTSKEKGDGQFFPRLKHLGFLA